MDQITLLQDENRRLHKALDELSILNDLARVISSTMNLDTVIESVVKRSVKAVHGQQGMITLVDEVAPTEMKTLVRTLDSSRPHEHFHLNQNILGWMMINKKPLVSADIARDERFSGVAIEGDLHSLICVPLLVKNRLTGMLAVFDKKDQGNFSEDDVRLLAILGAQSAQVLENARLYEQEQKKMAMDKELIAAREVQMSLLPKQLPQISNFEFAARTLPAQEIGGDFYDIIPLGDATNEIVIADVAGKGLPAALLATLGKGILYAQALQNSSPQVQIRQSNAILRGSLPRKSFITMLLAVVNSNSKSVTVSNAGHCYPLLYRASTNSADTIIIKGMPLNFSDSLVCEERTMQMDSGDCIVLYSDGVDEAQNASQEFFGSERLKEIVIKSAGLAAGLLMQKIIDEVKIFSKDVPQSDDITIIVIKAR